MSKNSLSRYNVELQPEDERLCEIYQSVQMKFAFCASKREENKTLIHQQHPFVLCRDFLGDALYATHFSKNYGVYGFNFNGEEQKVDLNETHLLLSFNDASAVKAILPVLHYYEEKVHWKKSKISLLRKKVFLKKKDPSYIFFIRGSKQWVSSPALISLYTLLWRLADVKREENESVPAFIKRCSKLNTNDGNYLRSISAFTKNIGFSGDFILWILKHHRRVFRTVYQGTQGLTTHCVHEGNGIVALLKSAHAIKQGELIKDNNIYNRFFVNEARTLIAAINAENRKQKSLSTAA